MGNVLRKGRRAREEPPVPPFVRTRRKSVSAEVYDPTTDDGETRVIHKTDTQRTRIYTAIGGNILFGGLDDEQREIVLDAMEEMKFNDGDTIIQQGDEGDYFYVIDSGVCEVWVEKEGSAKMVVELKDENHDSFGELALMYNCPRSATVKAKGAVVLWALDRMSFRKILLNTTSRKRKLYESFLEKVDILQPLSKYERSTVADALQPAQFQDGETIITQGTKGATFFIIVSGEVVFLKKDKTGAEVEVKRSQDGDYFGEIALLRHEPRQATARAVGVVKCVTLDRACFERLLGPCHEILKRNMEKYKDILKPEKK